jgi:hypothetical protein
MERRFLIISGARRTLVRRKGPGRVEWPVPTTGRVAPLPTMMEEGKDEEGDKSTIPGLEATWEEAPESRTHSEVLGGGLRLTVLKAAAKEWVSHGAGA